MSRLKQVIAKMVSKSQILIKKNEKNIAVTLYWVSYQTVYCHKWKRKMEEREI